MSVWRDEEQLSRISWRKAVFLVTVNSSNRNYVLKLEQPVLLWVLSEKKEKAGDGVWGQT